MAGGRLNPPFTFGLDIASPATTCFIRHGPRPPPLMMFMPVASSSDAYERDIGTNMSHDRRWTVTCDETFDAVAAVELWRHASDARVFNHPEWWQAAIEAFGHGRRLHVATVREGGKLMALWPLWLKRLGPKEACARVLEPVGMRATDYCLPLIRAGQSPVHMLDLMIDEIARSIDFQTLLMLAKLPADPFAPDEVLEASRRRGLACAVKPHPCSVMSLPSSYDELQRQWSKSHRGDVRRQIRRLSQAGPLELVAHRSRDEIAALLPALAAMHTANWRARTGAADFETGPMGLFLDALVRRLPLEFIDASELRIGTAPIGYHLGFRQGAKRFWYKPAFDIGWANYAPGKVHIALAARQSITDGGAEVDFMQGNEPYKKLWSDHAIETNTFLIGRRPAYPLWWWNARYRDFAAEYRY